MKFSEFYSVTLKRQTDQQKQLVDITEEKRVDVNDIPF